MSTEALNILIVDDDEDDALFTERMLKQAAQEFRVSWVSRYQEAHRALLKGRVDAAIIDYRLAGRSGVELIAGARADGCTVPMIVLTGQGDRSVDEEAMRAGAQDYLVKSELEPSSLERAVRYAVERSRNVGLLNRMGRIMDASIDEILLFEAQEFRIVQSNKAAQNNLGYSQHELSMLTPFDVFQGIPRDRFASMLRDVRNGARHDAAFEAENLRQDGTRYPVEVRLQYFDHEHPPLFLVTLTDLSERRQRDEQMQRAQKMEAVGQLAGGLAHDFNNLLTVISGNLEMLRFSGEAQTDSDRAEMVEEAAAAASRGADLTQRLLAFSTQQRLESIAVDVGALVANMGELLRRTLGVVVRFETLVEDSLPAVLLDAAQFENALLNLALNARDAMPDGGLLRVEVAAADQEHYAEDEGECSPAGQWIQVRVTDTGVGIDHDVLSQVLEPFFTTKRAGHGNGLGLSMVYGFVRQSGGRIGIRSHPGAGTTVTLSFPVAEGVDSVVHTGRRASAKPAGGSECILVVEDDDSVRRFASLTLSFLGYRVIQASNGDEALRVLGKDQPVDLLFTDLHMPGNTGGNDLVRILREGEVGLPILITSGFSASHDYKAFADVSFIPKPYSTVALARRVRSALEGRN